MIRFDTSQKPHEHWINFWHSVVTGPEHEQQVGEALLKYNAKLEANNIQNFWIVTFETEKDYLYYLMEWS